MGTLNNVKRHAVRSGTLKRVLMNMYPAVAPVAPFVDVEHIGVTNESWMLERLREAGKQDDEIKAIRARAAALTMADVAKTWQEEREQLILHGVRAIGGWYYDDADGEPDLTAPVPSTPEGIRDLVGSFDEAAVSLLVKIAVNAENFRTAAPSLPAADVAKK